MSNSNSVSAAPAKKQRNSSIEAMKILAIFLIVIFHVASSAERSEMLYNGQAVSICPSYDGQQIVFNIIRSLGIIGNWIFFVSSAWFLLESKANSRIKMARMMGDVWFISVIFLSVYLIFSNVALDSYDIRKSLFPTTFSANWFVTCYVLFYAIYPWLNKVIYSLTQRQLLKAALAMLFMYSIIEWLLIENFFFFSRIIMWIAVYFCVAYIKLYLPNFSKNTRANAWLLLLSAILGIASIVGASILGISVPAMKARLEFWPTMQNNPFAILFAISLINLMLSKTFHNRCINALSKLSLMVYVIHQNLPFREYTRPQLVKELYDYIDGEQLALSILLFAIILFVCSFMLAYAYHRTLQPWIGKLSEWLYGKLATAYHRVESRLLKYN